VPISLIGSGGVSGPGRVAAVRTINGGFFLPSGLRPRAAAPLPGRLRAAFERGARSSNYFSG
jgi:hypothetical protein